jgi:Skp family chaperone for outer membrane proteins
MQIRTGHLALLLAAGALAGSVWLRPTEARTPAQQQRSASIATVDLGKVLDRLNESADWDMRLRALTASISEEFQSRQAAIEARIREVEQIESETQRRLGLEDLALMRLRFEEWGRLKQIEVDRERSLKWQTLYRSIREEATRLAETQGFEIVLVNDSLGPLNVSRDLEVSQEQQVLQQIMNRRLLYAARVTDVTDQLIVRMNNARSVRP